MCFLRREMEAGELRLSCENFFLKKWLGASAVKKVDESLDSRQGPEPTARIEAIELN